MNPLEREMVDAADDVHEVLKRFAQTWKKVHALTGRVKRGHKPETVMAKLNQWAIAACNQARNDAYNLPKDGQAPPTDATVTGDL